MYTTKKEAYREARYQSKNDYTSAMIHGFIDEFTIEVEKHLPDISQSEILEIFQNVNKQFGIGIKFLDLVIDILKEYWYYYSLVDFSAIYQELNK